MTNAPCRGFILRLAGAFQSYGGPSAFNDRDTRAHPSRSALIGLFAAAEGRPREAALAPFTTGTLHGLSYRQLHFTIRVDAPGHRYTDFHTTGSSRPRHQQLRTANGDQRDEGKEVHISRRTYLTDAAFTVAVTGPGPLVDHIARTLEQPHWAPYLGRRNCVPDEPLVLARLLSNPVHHLLHHTPLTPPRPPAPDATTLPVTFWWDTPPPTRPAETHQETTDDPADLTPHHRTWTVRSQWRTTESLLTALYAGPHPVPALIAYTQEAPCTTSP